jgi:HNH endonuclease
MFDQDFLNSAFYIDYAIGRVRYRISGRLAGSKSDGRYVRIRIRGGRYYEHKVVWCMTREYWPNHDIDHWDGNGFNNHPDNLRKTTASQNIANADFGEIRGVEAHGAKFRARITVKGNRIELGSFDTREEATKAYCEGAEKYFGEFAFHNREA